MAPSVCFDALGTCFSVEPLVQALDEILGARLREADGGSRMVIMDWFHSAQRDYTYLSITSPPPPPMSKILSLTLARSITSALELPPSSNPSSGSLPDLSPIINKLQSLTPSPGLSQAFDLLKGQAGATLLLITNGAKSTTDGYLKRAGLERFVDGVQSCDEVGVGKPFPQVYDAALKKCEELGGGGERWFVAAHMWDVCAARKAGFKTGIVMAEQPPIGDLDSWWELWGGKPDVVGMDLEEVARGILGIIPRSLGDTT